MKNKLIIIAVLILTGCTPQKQKTENTYNLTESQIKEFIHIAADMGWDYCHDNVTKTNMWLDIEKIYPEAKKEYLSELKKKKNEK